MTFLLYLVALGLAVAAVPVRDPYIAFPLVILAATVFMCAYERQHDPARRAARRADRRRGYLL